MNFLRGSLRMAIFMPVLAFWTVIILAASWLPTTVRGVRLSAWPTTILARFFVHLFNIQFICEEADRIRQHQGFVFPNHLSYLDIILLVYIVPMRFLAKADVRDIPFIGRIATAIGTVYVDRGDKKSRTEARDAIAHSERYPPVALFPEGGIFPPAETLHPFRYGAFEIAIQGKSSILPAVFLYEPLDVVFWGDEPMLTAVWRLAQYRGPIKARLYALRSIQTQPDDDAKQMALELHGAMGAILAYGGHEEDIVESGI